MPKRLRSATISASSLGVSGVDQRSDTMMEAPTAQNLPHNLMNNIVNNSSANVSFSSQNLLEKMIIQSFDDNARCSSIDACIDSYEMLSKRKISMIMMWSSNYGAISHLKV